MRFHKPMLAAFLGFLATVAGELVTWILTAFGIGSYDMYQIDSLLVTLNRTSFFMGIIVNFIVGGAAGILLNYILSRFSADNVVNKAIALSLAAWFVFRLYSVAFIEARLIEPRPMADYYVHLIGAVSSGVALGLLFKGVLFKKQKS